MSPLSPLHIPTSHTICNPGQTWGLQDWLTGSANMFLSWLPSFKLWPHLHIIRAQSWWATQWSGSDTASAQTFSPSSQKQAIQRFATQTLHIINTSQPSQRASILQSTKPVNQNTNTFPYINDGCCCLTDSDYPLLTGDPAPGPTYYNLQYANGWVDGVWRLGSLAWARIMTPGNKLRDGNTSGQ